MGRMLRRVLGWILKWTGRLLVALLIFGYILLIGPVDYFFLKKGLGRLELTWISFAMIVVAVSVAAVGSVSLPGHSGYSRVSVESSSRLPFGITPTVWLLPSRFSMAWPFPERSSNPAPPGLRMVAGRMG